MTSIKPIFHTALTRQHRRVSAPFYPTLHHDTKWAANRPLGTMATHVQFNISIAQAIRTTAITDTSKLLSAQRALTIPIALSHCPNIGSNDPADSSLEA